MRSNTGVLPDTQRKCRPLFSSSISIKSTSFCFSGLNKTRCISSFNRDDISEKKGRKGGLKQTDI